jgi:hypothetical protein
LVAYVLATSFAVADSVSDLTLPQGCTRIEYSPNSFSGWIQRMPVKGNKSILTYRGAMLPARVYDRFAVLERPLLFSEDLEQCADFAMRLWADYHAETDRLDELFLFNYTGEKQFYSASNLSYLAFLRRAFAYTNSYSLKQGCVDIDAALNAENLVTTSAPRLHPGDMLIQNDTGGIGHVSMIVDACQDDSGNRYYLIGFSFMPAQEFHIERAPSGRIGGKRVGIENWFSYEGYIRFLNAYYPYGIPVLRRFGISE